MFHDIWGQPRSQKTQWYHSGLGKERNIKNATGFKREFTGQPLTNCSDMFSQHALNTSSNQLQETTEAATLKNKTMH